MRQNNSFKFFIAALLGAAFLLFFFFKNKTNKQFNAVSKSSDEQVTSVNESPDSINAPFSPETAAKIQTLREIFKTRNDNDPRLDSEFKNMTTELKNALIKEYNSLPKEKLNERGTIVFLLGREINEINDLNFFQQVMNESVCLSFTNCDQEVGVATESDHHLDSTNAVSLAYPQIMGLNMLKTIYDVQTDANIKDLAYQTILRASQSSSDTLRMSAEEVLKQIEKIQ